MNNRFDFEESPQTIMGYFIENLIEPVDDSNATIFEYLSQNAVEALKKFESLGRGEEFSNEFDKNYFIELGKEINVAIESLAKENNLDVKKVSDHVLDLWLEVVATQYRTHKSLAEFQAFTGGTDLDNDNFWDSIIGGR